MSARQFNPQNKLFLSLFGVSLAAFAMGFDDCLFAVDKAEACVAHAKSWVDKFQAVGDHIIAWMIAIVKAVFN